MGINGGLTARYISEKYFSMICGAQVELNFSQHGWSEFDEDHPELEYIRKMNYVEIPSFWHIWHSAETVECSFFVHAGPQIGFFFISDTRKKNDAWNNYTSTPEQHDKNVENKFDYGIRWCRIGTTYQSR